MEITNKTLAWLVLAAIVVSFTGTVISLNRLGQAGFVGYATSNATGQAQVVISSQTVLRFAAGTGTMNFGSGSADASSGNLTCNMSVNGSTGTSTNQWGCTGFSTTVTGGAFVLENAGTNLLNVTLNFSSNATTFLGGANPLFQYAISNNESSSCGTLNSGTIAWTNVVQQNATLVCTNLNYIDTTDSIMIGVKLAIPYDASQGTKIVNITAQGTG